MKNRMAIIKTGGGAFCIACPRILKAGGARAPCPPVSAAHAVERSFRRQTASFEDLRATMLKVKL